MTAEGRLARGKSNFDSKIFFNYSETLSYVATLETKAVKKVVKKETKAEEVKDE